VHLYLKRLESGGPYIASAGTPLPENIFFSSCQLSVGSLSIAIGITVTCQWDRCQLSVGSPWIVSGIAVNCQWDRCGLSVGPLSIVSGIALDCQWDRCQLSVGSLWIVSGIAVNCQWDRCGLSVGSLSIVSGIAVTCQWDRCGLSVGSLWIVSGIAVTCQWDLSWRRSRPSEGLNFACALLLALSEGLGLLVRIGRIRTQLHKRSPYEYVCELRMSTHVSCKDSVYKEDFLLHTGFFLFFSCSALSPLLPAPRSHSPLRTHPNTLEPPVLFRHHYMIAVTCQWDRCQLSVGSQC